MDFQIVPLTDAGRRFVAIAEDHARDFASRADQHDREGSFPLENIEALSSRAGRMPAANGTVCLGALVTHRDAEVAPLLRERLPVLAETFRRVGTIRIRHMGTVGGALAHADPNQDPPVTLLALGARVEVRKSGGRRELPLDELFRGYYETALRAG